MFSSELIFRGLLYSMENSGRFAWLKPELEHLKTQGSLCN